MEDLLDLVFEDPDLAWRRASAVLAGSPSPWDLSVALQARALLHREQGDVESALTDLRRALSAAGAAGDTDRRADVRATYGGTLVLAGQTASGVAELRHAADGASRPMNAKIRARLGVVELFLGRHEQGVQTLRAVVDQLAEAGNAVWEARIRNSLGYGELVLGNVAAAEREVLRSAELFDREGRRRESLDAAENLGEISLARGDVAVALRHFARATDAHATENWRLGWGLVMAHASALLSAGMATEAVSALNAIDRHGLPPLQATNVGLSTAAALLAAGRPAEALAEADEALRSCRGQSRPWFEVRARLTVVRSRVALGPEALGPEQVGDEARDVAELLHGARSEEAPAALLLASALQDDGSRTSLLQRAATYRTHPNALVRAAAWQARSLAREETGERGGVLRAAAAGLDAIDEHRRLIGSSELRALATTHGRELTTIALRHAATDPRTLLRWSERTRATALAQPPATSDAATIPAPLAALRDNGRRLAEARQEGEPTEDLEKDRLRLERAVRAESHTLSADSVERQRPVSAEEVVASIGDGCLVELVDVDGTLHVLVVHGGKVRRRVAGTTAEVAELMGPAAMLLRRTSRGRPADLTGVGQRLQEAVLGDAVRLLPEGPVVIAPTARLHGLPWALLPALHDRPFSVVPSAGQLLRARAATRPTDPRTVLVCGPGLATGGAEVPVLADHHPDAVLLDGPGATLEAVLAQLDGADLVHLAAHGRFRADSPLFSALDLADGPLTVHDLERLRRAPYRVVLSACESGVLAPVGAEELLGLAAALFSLGTAGLVSSVAEVNDIATADLMVDLHAALAAGSDPATALHAVRRSATPGSVEAATAAAFLALGV